MYWYRSVYKKIILIIFEQNLKYKYIFKAMQYIFISIYIRAMYSTNFSLFVYEVTLEFYGKYTIYVYLA